MNIAPIRTAPEHSNKSVCSHFFVKIPPAIGEVKLLHHHECKICIELKVMPANKRMETQDPSKGYTNLISHLKSKRFFSYKLFYLSYYNCFR